jgi:hypothetical protein
MDSIEIDGVGNVIECSVVYFASMLEIQRHGAASAGGSQLDVGPYSFEIAVSRHASETDARNEQRIEIISPTWADGSCTSDDR